MDDQQRELALKIGDEFDGILGDGLIAEKHSPSSLLQRFVGVAISARNSARNLFGDLPWLEDFIVTKALAAYDAWAKCDNKNLPDWIEDDIEAALRKVVEVGIRAAF